MITSSDNNSSNNEDILSNDDELLVDKYEPTPIEMAQEMIKYCSNQINIIQNSISHLQVSNTEMEEFDPQGKDIELLTAIVENEELIKKKKKELEVVRKNLINYLEELKDLESFSGWNDTKTVTSNNIESNNED